MEDSGKFQSIDYIIDFRADVLHTDQALFVYIVN